MELQVQFPKRDQDAKLHGEVVEPTPDAVRAISEAHYNQQMDLVASSYCPDLQEGFLHP